MLDKRTSQIFIAVPVCAEIAGVKLAIDALGAAGGGVVRDIVKERVSSITSAIGLSPLIRLLLTLYLKFCLKCFLDELDLVEIPDEIVFICSDKLH